MSEEHACGVSTVEIFRESWQVLRKHARLFVLLMGVPILAQLIMVIATAALVLPLAPGETLRDAWLGMEEWRKLAIAALFLGMLAVIYRALAASAFAAAEIHCGRNVSVWEALGHVRRRQLRLFWLLLLASMLTAPARQAAPFILLALGFFCAPAFPVAILEGRKAIKALERGGQLAQGGQGRVALLFVVYLALVAGGVFAFFAVGMRVEGLVQNMWYARPVPMLLGLWVLLMIPQWFMVALTLNYFDQRLRKGEAAVDVAAS
jgi:hypothetical protein